MLHDDPLVVWNLVSLFLHGCYLVTGDHVGPDEWGRLAGRLFFDRGGGLSFGGGLFTVLIIVLLVGLRLIGSGH